MSEKVTTGFSNPGFATENNARKRADKEEEVQSSSPGTSRVGFGDGSRLEQDQLSSTGSSRVGSGDGSRLEQDQSSSPGTSRAGSGEGCSLKLSNPDNQDDNHNIQLRSQVSPENLSEDSELENCGPPCCSLPGLNVFRNPKWFLVLLSFAAFIQGFVINGLVNVVITSIERRFGLQSTQTGLIASSYDIGSLLVMVPVSYLGGKSGSSKPRWIATGLLVMGIGSLIWSIPHFTTPPYSRLGGEEQVQLCPAGDEEEDTCQQDGLNGLNLYRLVFILGQLLHGAGASALVTLGTTFLDENVSVKSSPLYIAIFQTWFVIGPALGYVVGGFLLNLHTDLISDSGLTPESSLWVGAWWPGFLVSFILAFICSSLLFCYPPSVSVKGNGPKKSNDVLSRLSLTQLPGYLGHLFTNPTYLCVTIGQAMDGLTIAGLSAFLPKYLEHQFSLSNGFSAQLVGLIAVPAGGGGTFFGGWLIKRLKLNRSRILFMCCLSQVLCLIPILPGFLLNCDNLPFNGVNQEKLLSLTSRSFNSSRTASPDILVSECNLDCSCDISHFDPVCGSDDVMYLSPCLAGCTTFSSKDNYTDCACVQNSGHVSRIKCENKCSYLVSIIVILFIMIFITFFASMPGVVATLRAVYPDERSLALGVQSIIILLFRAVYPDERSLALGVQSIIILLFRAVYPDERSLALGVQSIIILLFRAVYPDERSLALGVQSIIIRLIGTIPGPVLFGYVVDNACMLWESGCDLPRVPWKRRVGNMTKDMEGKAMGWHDMSSLLYQGQAVNHTDKRTRNPNWTDGEISRFLEILIEEPVLRDLKEQKNKRVFCYVSQKMYLEGSEKSWDQCKIKLKNLKSQWRNVKDRVPRLDEIDLEDEAELKDLMHDCQNNGVSPFCVKHLRGLKRFLESLAAIKRGLPIPQYGPLDPTIMPPNLQMPHIVNIPERIQSVPDIDTRMKREIEESENDEEFIEPLVVDYPPEIGDPDNSSSSPLQPEPDRLALHPKLEPGRLDTSQGSTGEGFTESDNTSPRLPNLWIKSPSVINQDGSNKRKFSQHDQSSDKKVNRSSSYGGSSPESDSVLGSRVGSSLTLEGAEVLARLQTNLADKFLTFQKESELRYISWEREQVRMEQHFMEQWRLEQRQSLERWRDEQRRHDTNLLNLFTKFVSDTTEVFTKK
ncbi:solute carrier organic anion transporter family member 4A1 isoform X2 [Eurytemora carolleeae]|uniref:solute carrier organic anion transporter family member 4A1 isoform X2 n=1 Tax=Eurytemora carolleeae TaxID=1294199 RepID=UPI000C777318|nr:solute carrier organic anion transporter family member 4A1 isoform X2 [Eurytemora carolleeae]|eukprot:XP_023328222.1 solute carrier organic anion transporter family member 4A1-like isoform X2 [Eurytemora affinis]